MPRADPFDHRPRTADEHFRLCFYAAVYRFVAYARREEAADDEEPDHAFDRFPFLAAYFAEMVQYLPADLTWEAGAAWWEARIEAWEESATTHLPLRALTTSGAVDAETRTALLVLGLVEEDARFGAAFAALQQPLLSRRPCLGTLERLMSDPAEDGGWDGAEQLLGARLIAIDNADAPRSEWVLRIPQLLWAMMRSGSSTLPPGWCEVRSPRVAAARDELVLDAELLRQVDRLPDLVTAGTITCLTVRGVRGGDREAVAERFAAGLGRNVVIVGSAGERTSSEWALLGPICTLAGGLPVLIYDLAPGEVAEVVELTGYAGPVAVLLEAEGGVRGGAVERSVTIEIPRPASDRRRRLWRSALGGFTGNDLALISDRFRLPAGHIRNAAAGAIAHAMIDGRDQVSLDDARAACRSLNRQLLDTLATRIPAEATWDALVTTEPVTAKLVELTLRCRYRERLLDHLSPAFAAATARGVRALFTGGSGTGKTLAARILAAELGLDLYRVDLAAVVNKYIGETEKNLHRVLSTAEELDVVLLLDEGDALLGSRTQVKSANDRYANLETDYLLQRLEHYDGIMLVTTNAGDHIDSAFQRRMDVVIDFVAPGPRERYEIWQLHLTPGHAVRDAFLENLAVRCALTGAQIRNAALTAAVFALDGGVRVDEAHVEQAVATEYRKAGATSPFTGDATDGGQRSDLAAFVEAWS